MKFFNSVRVNELEYEHNKGLRNSQEELQNKMHKSVFQAEQDQAAIENCNITIQNLDLITTDLKAQNENLGVLYEQEKFNQKLSNTLG